MAAKKMFVEITKQCRVKFMECGVGSVVQLDEKEGNYLLGLKKAKRTDATAEKIVPLAKAKPESKAAERPEAKK